MLKDTVIQAQIVTISFENIKAEESVDFVVIFFTQQVEITNFIDELKKSLVNCEGEKKADFRYAQTTGSKSEILIHDDTKLKTTSISPEEAKELITALQSITIKK